MSMKSRQANYFHKLQILLPSALAGLLESYDTTSLFHDSIKSSL
jgi:hypothetical protein